MLEKLMRSIVQGLLTYLELWWERERRRAAEMNLKALEFKVSEIEKVEAAELRINSAVPKPVSKPMTLAAWNAGLALLLCLALSGCPWVIRVPVPSKWPVLELPARPQLVGDALTVRELRLIGYSRTLETRIDTYNAEARKHNEDAGY